MYNEASVVGEVVLGLLRVFDFVVCIDDGSTDGSAAVAASAGAVVIRHPVNLGQGAALTTGLAYIRERDDITHVVTFDADGQHDPADALSMVALARERDLDVVLGTRGTARPEGQPLMRRLMLTFAVKLSRRTSGLELTDTHNGLRVISFRALGAFNLRQRGMAYASELESIIRRHDLSWAEHPVTITYSEYSRSKGQGNINSFNIVCDLLTARFLAP
jgi:glycosyltransferase involved in cell wall biosynthesis